MFMSKKSIPGLILRDSAAASARLSGSLPNSCTPVGWLSLNAMYGTVLLSPWMTPMSDVISVTETATPKGFMKSR